MKYLLLILSTLLLITACESEEEAKHRRQLELIQSQGRVDVRKIEAEAEILDEQNDRLEILHGNNNSGGYQQPQTIVVQEQSSGIDGGDVLLGAAIGAFLMADWDVEDDGRYYNRKSGKYISEKEYYRRKAQSEEAKRKNAERKLSQQNYKPRSTIKPKPTMQPRATLKPKPTVVPKATPTAKGHKSGKITSFGGKTTGQKGYNSNTFSGNKTPVRNKHNFKKPKSRSVPKPRKAKKKKKR